MTVTEESFLSSLDDLAGKIALVTGYDESFVAIDSLLISYTLLQRCRHHRL